MAQVRDYRKSSEGVLTTVKVGDSVGFKSDVEQNGTITAIKGDMLTLFCESGFRGEYLRHSQYTVEAADDCWIG